MDALEAKQLGNELYKSGNYKSAVAAYSEAIRHEPNVHTFYGNRAAANMMLEKFGDAEVDCVKACELSKDYIKGYLRLAKARLSQVRAPSVLWHSHRCHAAATPPHRMTRVRVWHPIAPLRASSRRQTQPSPRRCCGRLATTALGRSVATSSARGNRWRRHRRLWTRWVRR